MRFKNRVFIIACIVLAASDSSAQTPKISAPELWWSIWHPLAALKVKKISERCQLCINSGKIDLKFDNLSNGGRSDAFRHVFYMAAFGQKIKAKKLSKLGQAHEKANKKQYYKSDKKEEGERPDSLSTVMDLYNNEIGIAIGRAGKNLTLEDLANSAKQEILAGKAMIIKRNKAGLYLDCEAKIIDLQLYKDKWHIPKCLVTSDYQYAD